MIDLIVTSIVCFALGFGVGYTIRDFELKPKKLRTWEVGAEEKS